MQYHPEAGSALAWGVMARKDSGRDLLNPLGEENRRAPQQAPGLSLEFRASVASGDPRCNRCIELLVGCRSLPHKVPNIPKVWNVALTYCMQACLPCSLHRTLSLLSSRFVLRRCCCSYSGIWSVCRHAVATVIDVTEDEDASHSEVFIQTRDRPGLLTDIVRTLKDINVNVVSAEVRAPTCEDAV